MRPSPLGRGIPALGLAAVLGLAAMGAAPAGPDPWAKVPPLPAGCFTSDGWFDTIQAAMDSMSSDIKQQQQTNDAVLDKFKNLDAAEKQSRMMTFLTAHPQEAAQFMQRVQALGQIPPDVYTKVEEDRKKLTAECDAIKARFDAVLDQATHAARAQIAALGDGEGAKPMGPADKAAVEKANGEYRRLCGEYWGASGAYQAWLKKYKDYLLKDKVPVLADTDTQQRDILGVFGVPSDNYRSTVTLEAVREYMEQTQKVFGWRWERPWDPMH